MQELSGIADLHLHTTASDGMLEAEAIVERAQRAGLRAIAITDHDTVAAHHVLGATAGDLQIIPGIELSCDTPWGELHLLGYHFDVHHAALLERLERLRQRRLVRLSRLLDRLLAEEIQLDDAFVADLRRRPGSVGRPHLARELVRMKVVPNFKEAFDRYLGQRGSCYVPHENGLTPEESIRLVRDAGGVTVIAHPGRLLEMAPADFMQRLRASGLTGIETGHPSHNSVQQRNCRRLALELGLVETAGSDFHSDAEAADGPSSGRHTAVGGATAPYEVVARMLALARTPATDNTLPSSRP